jgi:hypothetical protein
VRSLHHSKCKFPQARSTHHRSPAERRLPPRTGCPGRSPSHLPEPLDEFALSSATRRSKPRPKPCPGALFRASPACPPPRSAVRRRRRRACGRRTPSNLARTAQINP